MPASGPCSCRQMCAADACGRCISQLYAAEWRSIFLCMCDLYNGPSRGQQVRRVCICTWHDVRWHQAVLHCVVCCCGSGMLGLACARWWPVRLLRVEGRDGCWVTGDGTKPLSMRFTMGLFDGSFRLLVRVARGRLGAGLPWGCFREHGQQDRLCPFTQCCLLAG